MWDTYEQKRYKVVLENRKKTEDINKLRSKSCSLLSMITQTNHDICPSQSDSSQILNYRADLTSITNFMI